MIIQRIIKDLSETIDLIETSSSEGFKLQQNETGLIYGSIVVDTIMGYNNNEPYGKYTYTETDEKDILEEVNEDAE